MKGGSFLCHESYCASFRISAKMGVAIDSGSDHMGFRTVATKKMLVNRQTRLCCYERYQIRVRK